MKAFPAELELAILCCRWPGDEVSAAKAREIAGSGIDWRFFADLVRRHRIGGLVQRGLARSGITLPDEVREEMEARAATIARRDMAYAAESIRIRRALAEAGLPFLFIKGVTLGMLAFGVLGVKHASDIDLVVDPADADAAIAVVRDLDYVLIDPPADTPPETLREWIRLAKHTMWLHEPSGAVIELHTRFVDSHRLLPGVSVRLPSQEVKVGREVLPTLPRDALFAYLCVHGATHGWGRLKWLSELAALLGGEQPGEITALYRRAGALGAGRAPAQALMLASRLFGLVLEPELERELLRDRRNRWLADVALHYIVQTCYAELDEQAAGTVRLHLSHLFLDRGVGFKLGEIGRKSVNERDHVRFGLPAPLRFLYPLLAVPAWGLRRLKGRSAAASSKP